MAEIIKSALTGKEYKLSSVVRLINIQQSCFYVSEGIMPVDIYVSKDFITNKPMLVFLFDKMETKDLYAQWKDRRSDNDLS